GDDPDHARVPALTREHKGGRRGERGVGRDLALSVEQDRGLDRLALPVDGVELARDLERALVVGRKQQLEARVRAVETPGGVDAWAEAKAERLLGDALRIDSD